MDQEWIRATEEQKGRICEKHREAMRSGCASTAIAVVVFGLFALFMIAFSHYEAVNSRCRDILGYYPNRPPEYSAHIFFIETDETKQAKEEFKVRQQEMIEQAYAEVKPVVLREYLPYYVLWFLAVAGIMSGRILYNQSQIRRFRTEPLYYRKMRVVGQSSHSYRGKYYHHTSHKLTLKAEDGKLMEDVNSDFYHELEIDDMAILIKTQSSYDEYEAVYPASVLGK